MTSVFLVSSYQQSVQCHAGDKSQVMDIDTPDLVQFPKFACATRYECVMEPGDVLFIPGTQCMILHTP